MGGKGRLEKGRRMGEGEGIGGDRDGKGGNGRREVEKGNGLRGRGGTNDGGKDLS